jgi:hypothetical protein
LAIEDWKQPLPDHITFDIDHGMSVASTVGSGVPTIEDGKLVVRGTYSSLGRAQDVRTLVNEKHIRTTSVAFMSEKVTKDGKTRTQRELLNGAFVAIPSNRDSVVLASKSLDTKAGARHSTSDMAHVQAIYDHAVALGAAGPEDDSGAEMGAVGGKSARVGIASLDDLRARFGLKAKYNAETLRQMLSDGHAIANANGDPSYPIGDKEDLGNAIRAVGRGQGDHDKIRAYIIGRAKDLDASDEIPDDWNSDGSMKGVSAASTKALDPNSMVTVSLNGSAGGFDISVCAWCAPAAEIDAYADTAQRALAAALNIASGGPLDDDDDGAATGDAAPAAAGAAAKQVEADVLALKYRALSVLAAPAAI